MQKSRRPVRPVRPVPEFLQRTRILQPAAAPATGTQNAHNFELTLSEADIGDISRARQEAGEEASSAKKKVEEGSAEIQFAALDDAEADELLLRLPDMQEDEDGLESDSSGTFIQRESTLKAPKPGRIVEVPFPPPGEVFANPPQDAIDPQEVRRKAREAAGPLRVVRSNPTDDTPIGPRAEIAITFSHPMVHLAQLDTVDAAVEGRLGITLKPRVNGEWRWKGTSVLVFQPEHRFPFATKYILTVPKSAVSTLDVQMEEEYTLSFSTPAARVERWWPHGSNWRHDQFVAQELQLNYLAVFNQQVDAAAILNMTSIVATPSALGASRTVPVKLLTGPDADDWAMKHSGGYPLLNDHYVVFTTTEELPSHSSITVTIGPEIPSGEGPLLGSACTNSFRTYGPFTLGSNGHLTSFPVPPGSSWSINFTNPIDRSTLDSDFISIEPEVDDSEISCEPGSSTITIRNMSKPNTAYKLNFDARIHDTHGQPLTPPDALSLTTDSKRLYGNITGPSGLITVDTTLDIREHSVVVTNFREVRARLWQVEPNEYKRGPLVAQYDPKHLDRKTTGNDIISIGKLVSDKVIQIEERENVPQLVKIPYGRALQVFGTEPPSDSNLPGKRGAEVDSESDDGAARGRKAAKQSSSGRLLNAVSNFAHRARSKSPLRKKNSKEAVSPAHSDAAASVHPGDVGGFGQLILIVEPTEASWNSCKPSWAQWESRPLLCVWLQVSSLCPDLVIDHRPSSPNVVVWVNDLRTGAPIEGAQVRSLTRAGASTVRTSIDGTCVLDGAEYDGLVEVRSPVNHNDVAFRHAVNVHSGSSAFNTVFTFDDRNLYKPNETVSIKGIGRRVATCGNSGELQPALMTGDISFDIFDSRQAKVGTGETSFDGHGCFFFKIKLPDNLNLGTCRVAFSAKESGLHFQHNFKCEEFRRPEYSVSCDAFPPGPHVSSADGGGRFVCQVNASYFAGGPLTDASTKWRAEAKTTSYTPPGWSLYQFTRPKCVLDDIPVDGKNFIDGCTVFTISDAGALLNIGPAAWLDRLSPAPQSIALGEWRLEDKKTDQDGENAVFVAYRGNRLPPSPIHISLHSTVIDLNHQAQSAQSSMTLHPSSLYVGLRLRRSYGSVGEQLPFEVVVTDIDGNAQGDVDIDIRFDGRGKRRVEDDQGLSIIEAVADHQEHHLVSTAPCGPDDAAAILSSTVIPNIGGRYSLICRVRDAVGRSYESAITGIFVRGTDSVPEIPSTGNKVVSQQVELMSEKTDYAPGEVCKLLVVSPFDMPHTSTEGMIVVGAGGAQHRERFSLPPHAASIQLQFQIKEAWLPACTARLVLVGRQQRLDRLGNVHGTAPPRPAFGEGTVRLQINPDLRRLQVVVEPERSFSLPGKDLRIGVAVRDFVSGKPVQGAQVSVIVVDEAVLSLTGYEVGDPLEQFYSRGREDGVSSSLHRPSVLILSADQLDSFLSKREENDESSTDSDGSSASEAEDIAVLTAMPEARMMMASASSVRSRKTGSCLPQLTMACKNSAVSAPPLMKKSARVADRSSESVARSGVLELAAAEEGAADESAPIAVRTNFDALAAFEPSLLTDAEGRCEITIKLPDNLTRYRIWAVACTEPKFGKGESLVRVLLPLMARPSPPRFLNFGDRCTLSVVLQNQTDSPLDARVAIRLRNGRSQADAPRGFRVALPPLQRGAVAFPISTEKSGRLRFQLATAAKDGALAFADAVEDTFSVFTPATSEAFATYGDSESAEEAVWQTVAAPHNAHPEFGGLQVSTSSTALQSLTDAFLYLYEYQFECAEQLASRILGILSLRDALQAFKVPGLPSPMKIEMNMQQAVRKLRDYQYPDGCFGWWRYNPIHVWAPYATLHVGLALAMAKMKGVSVDKNMLSKLRSFLREFEHHLPWWMGECARACTLSECLWIRGLLGDNVAEEAVALFRRFEFPQKFSFEAMGWLLMALYDSGSAAGTDAQQAASAEQDRVISQKAIDVGDEILRHVLSNVHEEAEIANFVTDYGDDGAFVMLHSNRRTDAVMLEALLTIVDHPQATKMADNARLLIAKVCKGLMAHKKKGRWNNTQENCWILRALDKYFRVYEKDAPDFSLDMWLAHSASVDGQKFDYIARQEWRGRSVDTVSTTVPMKFLMGAVEALTPADESRESACTDSEKKGAVLLSKIGPGRLYWRFGLSYAPRDLVSEPANYGFVIRRRYESVEDKGDVLCVLNREEDNNNATGRRKWRMKLGKQVRVIITMTSVSRRTHVALVDKLPGGLEILNPALKGTPTVPNRELNEPNPDARPSLGLNVPERRHISQDRYHPFRTRWYNPYQWFEHQNLRDERAEAFQSLLWEGEYTFEYVCRATTEGSFVVPPAKAEEMYSPEVFGRSGTDWVDVVKE